MPPERTQRQPRLREACDGCFRAKVKCSRGKPMCSRCLACGLNCQYSPSSRAGRPRSNANANRQNSAGPPQPLSAVGAQFMMPAPQDNLSTFLSSDGAWNPAQFGLHGAMLRFQPTPTPSVPPTQMAAADLRNSTRPPNVFASIGLPWSPPADLSPPVAGLPTASAALSQGSAQPLDRASTPAATMHTANAPAVSIHYPNVAPVATMHPPTTPAAATPLLRADTNGGTLNGMPFTQSVPGGTFPANQFAVGPLPPAQLPFAPPRPNITLPAGAGGGSNPANLTGPCTCFTACLQSLRAQFDVSTPQSPPALETVVSVNRKAVDGCASMLGCWRCINRMGRHATAMLVGTVLGKVTSSYHAVARNHFGHGLGTVNAQDAAFAAAAAAPAAPTGLMPNGLAPPAGPGFVGAAAQQGGDGGIRSLELDILARDLDRLRNVYTYYCELCRHLSEDPEVTRAVIGHLGSSLSATLEMVRQFRQIIPRA
ncbi:hypothetical protein VTK26DRAFT_5419 [Humicola hyalothermophila]